MSYPRLPLIWIGGSYLSAGDTVTDGASSVMVIVDGNGHSDLSSIPEEAVYISHSTNTLWRGIYPTIFPPVTEK